jgi:hypothetical protein
MGRSIFGALPSTAELPNVAGITTAVATAAVHIRVHRKQASEAAILRLYLDERRKRGV